MAELTTLRLDGSIVASIPFVRRVAIGGTADLDVVRGCRGWIVQRVVAARRGVEERGVGEVIVLERTGT